MRLELDQISKTYAARSRELLALAKTSFQVGDGEFVSLLGPSGCGKSTILQLIAGLDEASSGAIWLDGERVHGPGRERGMVFQSYTLFPWLTVLENARFSNRLSHNVADDKRTHALLDLMGLRAFHAAYPRELSGGMQQRVAIVRALANNPKLLLMDEPFGAAYDRWFRCQYVADAISCFDPDIRRVCEKMIEEEGGIWGELTSVQQLRQAWGEPA